MPNSPVDALRIALDATGQVVAGIGDGQWDDPTPCSEWTVAQLTGHLIQGNDLFADALRGEPARTGGAAASADGPAWSAAYQPAADRLVAAFATEGALARTVSVPFGVVPGAVALHLRITEVLVHGWDLAQATRQRLDVPDPVVAAELQFTQGALQDVPADRSPFGPAQPAPPDAPALDRLAALLGRALPG